MWTCLLFKFLLPFTFVACSDCYTVAYSVISLLIHYLTFGCSAFRCFYFHLCSIIHIISYVIHGLPGSLLVFPLVFSLSVSLVMLMFILFILLFVVLHYCWSVYFVSLGFRWSTFHFCFADIFTLLQLHFYFITILFLSSFASVPMRISMFLALSALFSYRYSI